MKGGVLLFNIGTPTAPTPAAVRRYLAEFLMDPEVIDLPLVSRWLLVHGLILRTRPRRVAAAYAKIWTAEGSPLGRVHAGFARALQERWPEAVVLAANRYGEPSIDQAVGELAAAGVDRVLLAPLYPQYSTAATASSLRAARESLARRLPRAEVREIRDFPTRSEFVLPASHILREHAARFRPDHVIFSFHGLPERQIRKVSPPPCLEDAACCDALGAGNRDCYRAQCFATARAMLKESGWPAERASVAFQSRLGTTPWIKPYTDHLYRELPAQGKRRVLVVCPSFVADCLETLEEVAIRGREAFRAAGGQELELVPCVNLDERWVAGAARWLKEEMGA